MKGGGQPLCKHTKAGGREGGDAAGILRGMERGRILIREKKTKATSSIKPAEEGKGLREEEGGEIR